MGGRFDWKEHGFDKGRFEALTKLLRLRHGGQIEAPTRSHDAQPDIQTEGDDALDGNSAKASPLVEFGTGRLQRRFLDSLAELIADEKGGRHVAATMMTVGSDSVTIAVAKNGKIRPSDEKFLESLESLLQLIAAGSLEDKPQDALWAALLAHHESRIQGYLVELRQLLKRYQQHRDATSNRHEGAESSLVSQLSELRDIIFRQQSSTTSRNDALVLKARVIHKLFSSEEFAKLDFPAFPGLRDVLGFLGKLRTSFNILVAAAEKLESFNNLRICVIRCPKLSNVRRKTAVPGMTPWSLAQLFQHLGRPLTDEQAQTLLGSSGKGTSWTKAKLVQEFSKLKAPTWEVHAEMQLLQHCITGPPNYERIVPYFGCSKHSCFLCWNFLRIFQGFSTRGCHGKLYNLWGLPDFEGVTTDVVGRIIAVVRGLEALLEREILKTSVDAVPLAKESTIGASSIHTLIPTYERPELFETVQREQPDAEVTRNSTTHNQPGANTEATEGQCGNIDCNMRTTRRCSHCSGQWYCSSGCEEADIYSHRFYCSRGPVTTAHLLERDCYADQIPEDPQVREDYGFTRCRNRTEESHLCGVYQGLFKRLEVTAEGIDRWRIEGMLMEKITEMFSTIPERSRGGYYPWLIRNQYVLDEGSQVVRDEDNVELHIQRMLAKARPYLGLSDRNTPVEQLAPFAKQNCFHFLAVLLDSSHPPPLMQNLDLWYEFGFAVCSSTQSESSLAQFYTSLLLGNRLIQDYFRSLGSTHFKPPDYPTCQFEEFWKAWQSGTLMDLFDAYGDHGGRASYGKSIDFLFPDLREFLSYPGIPNPKFPRPSVWRLRQFLAVEGADVMTVPSEMAAAALEYGFHPQLDVRTKLDLHAFYTRVFQRGVYTRKVDAALRRGRLHDVADRWYGEVVDERVKAVLRAVSRAGRAVPAEFVEGEDDEDMYDMWKTRYTEEEVVEEEEGVSDEGGVDRDDDQGGGMVDREGELDHQPQAEKGWCTIQ